MFKINQKKIKQELAYEEFLQVLEIKKHFQKQKRIVEIRQE